MYPGHPSVVAYIITQKFKTYSEAFERKHTCPAAVLSIEVPGASGSVYAALDMLRSLRMGRSLQDALDEADTYWRRNHRGESERWQKGQEEADKIKPLLAEQKAWWKT